MDSFLETGVKPLVRPILAPLRRFLASTVLARSNQADDLAQTLRKLDKRTRNIELGVQALIRKLYLDGTDLQFPYRLTAQRFKLSSQNEEDGLTWAIFNLIGTTNQRFVEIGSGSSGGNSGFLARECGWTGLMIDGSPQRVEVLKRRFNGCDVVAVAAWVSRENVNNLLQQHGFTGEIDLLSIDIDGNDYWVWEAMTVCNPRLVIIEYNSLFGPDRAVVVPYDPTFDRHTFNVGGIYFGASLAALAHLAKRKGYRLITTEPRGVNAYFLRNDVAPTLPGCEVSRAFRLLDKYIPVTSGPAADIYTTLERAGLPLVDVGQAS